MNNILNIDPRIQLKDAFKSPKVVRVNKFDEENVKLFHEGFVDAIELKQDVVPIIIDSYGGQVYALMEMISIVQNCPIPVATICMGKAMSCGAYLFCMGKQNMRYMSPHATLMFHDVSAGNHGKIEEIKTSVKQTEWLNQHIAKITAVHLGLEEDFFLKKIHDIGHAEWFLSAEEANKLGICNQIKVPSFETKIEIKQSFG